MAKAARNAQPRTTQPASKQSRTQNLQAKHRMAANDPQYDTSKRRIKPNTQVINNTTPVVSQSGSAPSTDEIFAAQYAKQGVQPQNIDSRQAPVQNAPAQSRNARVQYSGAQQVASSPKRKRSLKKKLRPKKAVKARLRGTTVTLGIWPWTFFTYFIFQLPIAVLSLVFLGLAGAVDRFATLIETARADNKLIDLGMAAVEVVGDTLSFLNKLLTHLTGFDLGSIITNLTSPATYFFVTYLVVLAYGIIILLAIYLLYTLAFLKPLSGRGGGAKLGLFLLAFIGYSVPFLNLFPWFFPWTLAVLRHPK